jgi:contractile injection system tube protein
MTANEPPAPKLSIRSLEGSRIVVTAMFNPKEVAIDKSVPWQKARSVGDQSSLEFTSAEGRLMSFELMFDGFESGTNVHTAFVANLLKPTLAQDVGASDGTKRPPRVSVKWGVFPEFQGVIESVSTKYTMFLPDGTPVRATCHVEIREASHVTVAG